MPTNLNLRITDETGELRYFAPVQKVVSNQMIEEIQKAVSQIISVHLGLPADSEDIFRIELNGTMSAADHERERRAARAARAAEDFDEIDCVDVGLAELRDAAYDPDGGSCYAPDVDCLGEEMLPRERKARRTKAIPHTEPATSSLIVQLGSSE